MSSSTLPFSPHLRHEPDDLAAALLESLARPPSRRMTWSTPKTAIIGLFTLGLVPLLVLSRRLRQHAALERQQMWHLAEWLRLQTGRPEASVLRDETARLQASPLLTIVAPGVFVIICMATLAGVILESSGEVGTVRRFVYGGGLDLGLMLPLIYVASLCCGYLLGQWMAVNEYIGRMRRFVGTFNQLASAEGVATLRVPSLQPGLSAGAIIIGVLFALTGAVWGLPMMIASAAQRRYINRSSPSMRRDLAHRVRELLRKRHPHIGWPMPAYIRHPCINERCSASVPAGARFCSRCGTPAEVHVDRVA